MAKHAGVHETKSHLHGLAIFCGLWCLRRQSDHWKSLFCGVWQHAVSSMPLQNLMNPGSLCRDVLEAPCCLKAHASNRPIRCAICKVLATAFLAAGHWFEERAGSQKPMALAPSRLLKNSGQRRFDAQVRHFSGSPVELTEMDRVRD